MAGKLYVVGTPIGNLGDITIRAQSILAECDFIAAEDTRVTLKLLSHLNIHKPLVSYHEHNRAESGEKIIARIISGENCALVTDAGMPAISDPGEELVKQCADAEIDVVVVPGPCAAISALAVSGLPTGRFTFEGFLSVTKKNRYEHLDSLRHETRTMVFYEAPHKLIATLQDMLEVFGNRKIAISRELTKIHEETTRTSLEEALEYYRKNPPRGEFVLVIDGARENDVPRCSIEDAIKLAQDMKSEGMSLKDAVRRSAQRTGVSKNELYDRMISDGGASVD